MTTTTSYERFDRERQAKQVKARNRRKVNELIRGGMTPAMAEITVAGWERIEAANAVDASDTADPDCEGFDCALDGPHDCERRGIWEHWPPRALELRERKGRIDASDTVLVSLTALTAGGRDAFDRFAQVQTLAGCDYRGDAIAVTSAGASALIERIREVSMNGKRGDKVHANRIWSALVPALSDMANRGREGARV